MATPKNGYYTKDRIKVPSVTTIIGRFKDSNQLIQWAYKQGREHENMANRGLDAPSSLYEKVNEAAQIGTAIHSMVEADINGKQTDFILNSLPSNDMKEKANSGFQAFLSWKKLVDLRIEDQEIPMVSELYAYGGTPDAVGYVGDDFCIIDWKSSSNIYQDHLIQIAAYKQLWDECMTLKPSITGGFHLLRFSKENGDFAHHAYKDLSEAWESFLLMRRLYDLDKALKKRAA